MIFGNNKIFQIDARLSQVADHTFINYCFLLDNGKIGDISQASILNSTIYALNNIISSRGTRQCKSSNELCARAILTYLEENELINEGEGQVHEPDFSFDLDELRRLELDLNAIESFDGYRCFLIEEKGFERLICRDIVDQTNFDLKLPKGYFYDCMSSLSAWITSSTFLALRQDVNQ